MVFAATTYMLCVEIQKRSIKYETDQYVHEDSRFLTKRTTNQTYMIVSVVIKLIENNSSNTDCDIYLFINEIILSSPYQRYLGTLH